MLPWIFAILILLNTGLFVWGYQREKSLEPPSMPVPEGSYKIRLLGEPLQPEQQGRPNGKPEQSADAREPEGTGSSDQAGESDAKDDPKSLKAISSGETGVASNDAQPESEAPADTEIEGMEAESPGRSGQPTADLQQEDQRPNDPDVPEPNADDDRTEVSARRQPEAALSEDDGAVTNELF